MQLVSTKYYISKCNNGNFKSNIFQSEWKEATTNHENTILQVLYDVNKRKDLSDYEKVAYIKKFSDHYGLGLIIDEIEPGSSVSTLNALQVEDSIQKLIDFFTEFEFEPNFRFINTFAFACNNSKSSAKDYVVRYFELTDSPYTSAIEEKMKSDEFRQILKEFAEYMPTKHVNSRLKLYYGSAGTGKTTEAMKESDNRCIVCHSAMLPNDIMEDFKFVDGKPEFSPSALEIAMTEGQSIVLDEINMLPFESLKFLQTFLDGKDEFIYKNRTVKIKDGFQIIGTMNLVVNGDIIPLPEPLVDRCYELKKFKLTAKNLVGAII